MALIDATRALPARAITGTFAAVLAPSAFAFERALADPKRAQQQAFARAREQVLALGRVRSLDHLRELPFCTYDDVAKDIERVADGVGGLTRAPVTRFELSGGSSGAHKLVPMTQPFLHEMNRALSPWLFSLYARTPGVAAGCAYWSVSPLGGKARGRTRGNIPIGADDDASWFPAPLRALLSRVLAVPSTLAGFTDLERCRYATLRLLLERDDLALISVWSPTFLTLLMNVLDRCLDRLLFDLERGTLSIDGDDALARTLPLRAHPARAARLMAIAKTRALSGADLWPKLALLSLWTDAAAASFVAGARARFPGVPVQGKGLLATEGVTSIPWPSGTGELIEAAPVLAVRSHVLEFLEVLEVIGDDRRGDARFAHEIEEGRVYEVVLTTSAGLVRYRTGDLVRVQGCADATPRVRFIGRAGMVSDLVGEKLSAAFVGSVLDDVVKDARFAMLAPCVPAWGAPRYRLYLQAALPHQAQGDDQLARAVDARLKDGHPYRYARELGQLGPVELVRVRDGAEAYERGCLARGQRAGDIKPTPLHPARDWEQHFSSRRDAC